jgi:arabinofuranosyltransferase
MLIAWLEDGATLESGSSATPGGTGDSYFLNNRDRHFTLMLSSGVVLFALIAFGALAFRFFPYTMDDAYITFRYSLNLAAGHGLVFNPGEQPRAEGITSPLYATILAIAPLTGVDVVTSAKWVGLLACVLTAVLIGAIVYTLTRSLTSLVPVRAIMFSILAAAYFLSNPYVVGNTLSGMETALATMTFGAFLFLVVKILTSSTRPTFLSILCLGLVATLVPLLRPEMGLSVVFTLATAGVLAREARPTILSSLAVFLMLSIVYYCLRFLYYELPFPLPFYIKQGSFGFYGLSDLESYLKQLLPLLPLVFVCLAFAIGPHCGERKRPCAYLMAVMIAVGVQLAYYASIRHIMGFGFRYFVPTSVGLISLAFVGGAILYEVATRSRLSASFSLPSLFVALIILSIGSNAVAYRPAHDMFIDWYATGERRGVQIARSMRIASQGTWLRIALNDCGAIPFYTGFSIVDLSGLNNRAIALARTPDAARNEIREKRPHLVILVSKRKHDPTSLQGWERLSHEDVTALGYSYVGTITVGTWPDGEGYHLLVYGNGDPIVLPFLERLAQNGVLDIPPVESHR